MGVENRQYRRVVVGSEFTVSFVHQGESFAAINLGNISEGGCFVLVPGARAGKFRAGARLEALTLHHERVPAHPIEAQITFALGADDPDLEWAGVGVQFVELPPIVSRSLRDFVDAIPDHL